MRTAYLKIPQLNSEVFIQVKAKKLLQWNCFLQKKKSVRNIGNIECILAI